MKLSKIDEEMWFFIYLLEHYANYKGRLTGDVLQEWDRLGITDEIYNGYFQYHQERIENAYDDIDCLAATGKHLANERLPRTTLPTALPMSLAAAPR